MQQWKMLLAGLRLLAEASSNLNYSVREGLKEKHPLKQRLT
jgi:hypothetical protein